MNRPTLLEPNIPLKAQVFASQRNSQPVGGDGKFDCALCLQIDDSFINSVLNVLLEDELGICSDVCAKLPKELEKAFCDIGSLQCQQSCTIID